jgi:hypothetical protein
MKLINDSTKIFNIYNEMAYGIASDPAKQQYITRDQLMDLIINAENMKPGTNFFSLTQITKAATRKAPFPKFVLSGLKDGSTFFAKVSQVNGMIGADYGSGVNTRREKEGKAADFVPQASQYDAVEGSKAIQTSGGNAYFYYTPRNVAADFKPVYVRAIDPAGTEFKVVDRTEVEPYTSQSAGAGAYQGLEKGLEVRKVSVDSIAAINIAGDEYIISDLDPVRKKIWTAVGF